MVKKHNFLDWNNHHHINSIQFFFVGLTWWLIYANYHYHLLAKQKTNFLQMTRVHDNNTSSFTNDHQRGKKWWWQTNKSCMTSWMIFSFHSKTKYYNDNYYYLPSVFWSSLFVDDDFVLFCFAGKRWWWTENIEKIGINYFLLLAFLMIIFCCFFLFFDYQWSLMIMSRFDDSLLHHLYIAPMMVISLEINLMSKIFSFFWYDNHTWWWWWLLFFCWIIIIIKNGW